VKIDGDGQMDPDLITQFVQPIIDGEADYTKGNRFYNLDYISQMPLARICGNAILSFMTKLSSGYWDLFDPTNGYTAIHASVAAMLPLSKISPRYFFESDILFRLNTIRAVVRDIPIRSVYGSEVSNLHIGRILPEFIAKHVLNTSKRICYNYYLRNFSLASVELVIGVIAIGFGCVFGTIKWLASIESGGAATAGTVMLAALPVMLGIQFILAFFNYDIVSTPRYPISRKVAHLPFGE
jgi:dolichol-phosphate mannosyltransferase